MGTMRITSRKVRWIVGPVLLSVLAVILIAVGGCAGFGVAPVVEMRTTTLGVDYPASDEVTEVVLGFGAAEFYADARGSKLVEGTVRYNVLGLNPDVSTSGSRVEIKQSSNVSGVDMKNEWDVHFGTARPIRLEVNAGAYDGDWDLGGIPLQKLTVNQGASRSSFDFSAPNPETMDRLEFRTGAASLELRNLANAGFRQMSFEGGASKYTLDFGGELMRDGQVNVTVGVSDLTIIIPPTTPAQIILKESISGRQVDEEFDRRGDSYYTPGWDTTSGPRLTIEIRMGLGNINLRSSAQSGEL